MNKKLIIALAFLAASPFSAHALPHALNNLWAHCWNMKVYSQSTPNSYPHVVKEFNTGDHRTLHTRGKEVWSKAIARDRKNGASIPNFPMSHCIPTKPAVNKTLDLGLFFIEQRNYQLSIANAAKNPGNSGWRGGKYTTNDSFDFNIDEAQVRIRPIVMLGAAALGYCSYKYWQSKNS